MDLKRWNPWWDGVFPETLAGIERGVTMAIRDAMKLKKVIVVTGPRRSGKTTVLYQVILQEIKARGHKNVFYVPFDDPQFDGVTIDAIIDEYVSLTNPVHPLIVVDEAQEKPEWAKWAKSVHDRGEAEILVSGSTSYLLTRSDATYLAGRSVSYTMYPLSFAEFLSFNRFDRPDIPSKNDENRLAFFMNEFLTNGAYPEIVLADPVLKPGLIASYFDTLLARDVVTRLGGDIKTGSAIARHLIATVSSKVSTNAIRKSFGIGSETAARWLAGFASGYLILEARKFSYSVKEQAMEKKKYYVIDNSFIRLVQPSYTNAGKLLENAVATEIVKSGHNLYYWQGKHECDFIITENDKPVAGIQVTKDPEKLREVEGLEEARDALKLKHLWLVGTGRGKAGGHDVFPLWDLGKLLQRAA
jgi:predicted AAA+ superfamily ATPase